MVLKSGVTANAEKLQNENRAINKKLHEAYKQARSAAKTGENHPNKNGSEHPMKK